MVIMTGEKKKTPPPKKQGWLPILYTLSISLLPCSRSVIIITLPTLPGRALHSAMLDTASYHQIAQHFISSSCSYLRVIHSSISIETASHHLVRLQVVPTFILMGRLRHRAPISLGFVAHISASKSLFFTVSALLNPFADLIDMIGSTSAL